MACRRAFMAAEIVGDDDISGLRVGTRSWPTQAVNDIPLIGPSVTQGATMRSRRSPARKVSIFPCPHGTMAIRGARLGLQPRVRIMLA